ncbi:hypothetical protein P3W45_001713 [Vairimorpha bombi]|jgi:hypothetical protein
MASSELKKSSDSKKDSDTTDSFVERELKDVVDDITLNSDSHSYNKNNEEAGSKDEADPSICTYQTDTGNQNNDTESTMTSEVQTVKFTENFVSESIISDSSTLDFTPMILKSVHSGDDPGVILDREETPVKELGFEENIILPRDFESTDVKLMIDKNGFCLFSDKENPRDSETKTASYHQMKYTRIFDRPIRNVDMEYVQGRIVIYGEFDDYDYPQ